MMRWGVVVVVYATLGAAAAWGTHAAHGSLWSHPEPWLELGSVTSHLYSTVIGLTFGLAVVAGTGPLVRQVRWAQTLVDELRPYANGLSGAGIVGLALLSSLGEEFLFRGLLSPWVTVWGQAALFGIVHQLPGRARWIWVVWATIMGLALGALYQCTGSLLGPVVAHATINGFNLSSLQHQPAPQEKRSMGGVLGHRT